MRNLKYFLLLSLVAILFSCETKEHSGRKTYVEKLYGGKPIPKLWVPLLTHFKEDGASIDAARTGRHLISLRGSVGGVLIPGSTGEGWELASEQQTELLKQVLPLAKENDLCVSIGVLKTNYEEVKKELEKVLSTLKQLSGATDTDDALAAYNVKGFTICNPKGEDIAQANLFAYWEDVLGLGLPTIFYQLPQVTENELSAESLEKLLLKYDNLYMVKDTSGKDAITESGKKFDHVFFVRGFEGDYYKHLKSAGGKYDGFLLGAANAFAKEFSDIIKLSDGMKPEQAAVISMQLDDAIQPVFRQCGTLNYSNPFTVSNKAFDYFKANGMGAEIKNIAALYQNKIIPDSILTHARARLADLYVDQIPPILETGYLTTNQ